MVVVAGANDGREHDVGAFGNLGRHSKSGPEQDHHRRRIRSLQPLAQIGVAGATLGARGGVHDERACAGDSRCRGYRVVEFRDDLHALERLAPARIVGPAEVETPMIDHARREFALLGYRMDDEHAAHVVGSRGARDIVNVEAGYRRGNGLGVAVYDRMMNQRYEKIGHTQNLRRSSRSGRRRAVRRFASASRHARILAWSPLSRISGTVMPRNSSGRVYCGYSSIPAANDSSSSDSGFPSTPGISLPTASITAIAGISPPLST